MHCSPSNRNWLSLSCLVLCAWLGGCAVQPSDTLQAQGKRRCESFFIYVLCIADYDDNGRVDYMYFDDTKEIFMYDPDMTSPLQTVLPFHPCAIPMSPQVGSYSSELLYDEDLGLARRLAVKGRLINSYRASQPAIDACYADLESKDPEKEAQDDELFFPDDEWPDEEWGEGT